MALLLPVPALEEKSADLGSLLIALQEAAGPQFPTCLFERPVRQPSFQRKGLPNRALFTHSYAIYDSHLKKTFDTLEMWCAATATAAAAAAGTDDLQFGSGDVWLPADELRARAQILLQEYRSRVPTLSELLQHVYHLQTKRDALVWSGLRWEDSLYVFDTDNRPPTSASARQPHFFLRCTPRVSCKFQGGKFVDTASKKTFQTLEGWLAVCGYDSELDDVRFSCRRSKEAGLAVSNVYHRLQALLHIRNESYKIYSKCVWRYQSICKEVYDEEEWSCWEDEEDEDTVWSEDGEEGDEEGDEEEETEENEEDD